MAGAPMPFPIDSGRMTGNSEVIDSDEKRAFRRSAWRSTPKKLCHNCDAKPAFTVKTDFIGTSLLLILRKLLKTRIRLKIPAYMARPLLFNIQGKLNTKRSALGAAASHMHNSIEVV
jgi:hypothetical protein